VLSDFSFVFPVQVRFRDLDALGHVNNAVYLTYLESARIAWWLHVTGRTSLQAMDMILARIEVDYRSPAEYPEMLDVGLRCASLGRSSFVLESEIRAREGGRLVAEARKVLVLYDYAVRRSRPLTDDLRARLRAQDPGLRDAGGESGA
jgi:acyl-CoA thioester hydrolase